MSAPGMAGAESRRRDPARQGKPAIASLQGEALPSHVAKECSPAPLSHGPVGFLYCKSAENGLHRGLCCSPGTRDTGFPQLKSNAT